MDESHGNAVQLRLRAANQDQLLLHIWLAQLFSSCAIFVFVFWKNSRRDPGPRITSHAPGGRGKVPAVPQDALSVHGLSAMFRAGEGTLRRYHD